MFSERWTTLSPFSAEMGMKMMSWTLSRAANSMKSDSIRSYCARSQSMRSILFTQTTMWGTPSMEERKAWRRVCSITPLRASIRISDTCAVEAPVTMLRVYSVCPGVSAMMNLRLGVAK